MDDLFTFDPLLSGTKGLVFLGDLVIVYRRDNKTNLYPLSLDLPGGGTEHNETPFETFKREVQEEFDLTIEASDIAYARKYPSSVSPGKYGYFVVAKLDSKLQDRIRFGDEGIEYMLMTLDEYLKRADAWPIFQERAADYLKTLNG